MSGTAATVLLLVSSAAVILVTVFLARMIQQLVRTASQVEHLARSLNDDLLPKIERVLDQTEAELVEIKAITRSVQNISASADRVVSTVGDVVVRAQDAITPGLNAVAEFSGYLRQGMAMMVGLKAGLGALRRRPNEEVEEETWGV
jgi:predicted PurR-regulated permease PerM